MAKENVSQIETCDKYNELTKKICQLHALLTMSQGEALEILDTKNDSLREHYYWACADLAKDCGDLLAAIPYPVVGAENV